MAWEDRELPILQAVHGNEAHHDRRCYSVGELAQQLEWEHERTLIGIRRLIRSGYVDAVEAGSMSGDDWARLRLIEKGLREVGDWPSRGELVLALATAMLQVSDELDDSDQADRLREGGNALLGAAREVAMRVGTNLLTSGVMGAF